MEKEKFFEKIYNDCNRLKETSAKADLSSLDAQLATDPELNINTKSTEVK